MLYNIHEIQTNMIKFSFCVNEELNQKIEQRAKVTGKSKPKIMREALEKGLKKISSSFCNSTLHTRD